MARGDRPVALEQIVPYFRGARFGVLAMQLRHGAHDADLGDDAQRYLSMVDGYVSAAIATFRMKRERDAAGRA